MHLNTSIPILWNPPMNCHKPQFVDKNRLGFSLVELLVVISIISVLAALSAPAIASLNRSGSLNRTLTDISLSFEQARAYAMANNTYVWVGLKQDAGSSRVMSATVASLNSVSSDLKNADNLRAISRVKTFDNVQLSSALQDLQGMSADASHIEQSTIGSFKAGQGANGGEVFPYVVQFSPSGEVRIGADGMARWIQVGLAGTPLATANYAVIQLSSLTGGVRIFRP